MCLLHKNFEVYSILSGRSFAFSIIPKVEGERVYNIFADSANDLKVRFLELWCNFLSK